MSFRVPFAAVLCVLIFSLSSCGEKVVPKLAEKVPDRALVDLSLWSFEEDGPARLFGNTWEFYWRRLYTPVDFNEGRVEEKPILIPSGRSWSGVKVDGAAIDEDGFATYRTIIELPEAGRVYSFYIKNQDSSYRFWVNGDLLAQNGIVATNAEAYTPQRLPRLFSVYTGEKSLEIIVQVANYTHRSSGLTNNIYFGLPGQIQSFVHRRYGTINFLAGAILIMAAYHLFLFITRKKEPSSLFFFLFCISVLFWYLFNGDYLFFRLFPSFPLGPGIRLQYFAMSGVLPFFLLFLEASYPKALRKIFVLVIMAAGFCLMLFPLLTPVKFFTAHTLKPFYILAVTGGMMALYILIRSLASKNPGAGLSLIGFAVFMIAAVYDMAADMNLFVGSALGPFVPAGLFVFILFQSFIMAGRFSAAYDSLDNLTDSLERTIRLRTAELQKVWRKMHEQEKLAALGTIVGGISHEIFNPLSGISGPLSVVKKEIAVSALSENNMIMKHLAYMESNVEQISSVVNNLHALVQERAVEKLPVALLPVVDEVVRANAGRREKPVEFSVEIDHAAEILADAGMLYQILSNLVSNAVDAVGTDGFIRIRYEKSQEPGGGRITVEDNGGGMTEQEAACAFDVFYTTKEKEGGTGMGLFLASKFTEALGWTIRIETRKGGGTRVEIIL